MMLTVIKSDTWLLILLGLSLPMMIDSFGYNHVGFIIFRILRTNKPNLLGRNRFELFQLFASSCPHSAHDAGATLPSGAEYSTLTLLEHMHLLTPNLHDNRNSVIDFFVNTMGFGLDPKGVGNVENKSGVVFVNCGPSQLHLNDEPHHCQKMEELYRTQESSSSQNHDQTLPAFEIGLRYTDLNQLKDELSKRPSSDALCSYNEISINGSDAVRITDVYGRVFVVREALEISQNNIENEQPTISSICQQQVIHASQEDSARYPSEIVKRYGISPDSQTRCEGIDYIEFFVPVTKKDIENGEKSVAEKIAKFYEYFLDATTTVVNDGISNIAIIGFGKIDGFGRAEQSLLFREVLVDNNDDDDIDDILERRRRVASSDDLGTGHHIAIYVGSTDEDYRAFATRFSETGGLMWINPLFEDKVIDVDSAMTVKQFRFKDIIDIETGDALYVLEHEIRSIDHPSLPGRTK